MLTDDDTSARATALAALREKLRDTLGSQGYTRKDVVSRSVAVGMPLAPTTISQALNDGHRAPSLRTVTAIARAADANPETCQHLRNLWHEATRPPVVAAPGASAASSVGPGSVLAAGPALLEVQRAPFLTTDSDDSAGSPAGVVRSDFGKEAALTPYLARPHDQKLERLLAPALDGAESCFVMLTGDSSTGKTRALFESLLRLAPNRPLWRPTHAAALADLLDDGRVVPGEVLWLNEAQRFLYGDRSEESAAALRELLITRTGITVVGTLWTFPYWEELIRPSVSADARSHVRALLDAPVTHRLAVPAELTSAQGSEWKSLAESSGDGRMGQAGRAGAADGRVVQHLSGGPQLLDAYRMGPGSHFTHAEHALITAAIAARHAGYYAPLPEELLAHVADAALPPRLRPAAPGWAHDALTALATGARADGRRTDIRNTLTALVALRDTAGGTATYEPADYLQQNVVAPEEASVPVPALWDAMTAFTTDPSLLMHLSLKAGRSDFTKQAVMLLRRATMAGYPTSWIGLLLATPRETHVRREMALWMTDHARWESGLDMRARLRELAREGTDVSLRIAARAVAEVDLSDANGVGRLLLALRDLGHEKLLLDVDPVALVGLPDAYGTSVLLGELIEAGYTEHATRLTERIIAGGAPLEDPRAMRALVAALRVCAPLHEGREALASGAATHADLSNDFQSLLDLVEELTADHAEAARLLALRVADTVDPEDPEFVASALYELQYLGMTAACRRLAEQAVPRAVLEEPEAVGWLLEELKNCGFADLLGMLLSRDPLAQLVIGSVRKVIMLVWGLRIVGREDLAQRLLLSSLPDIEIDDAEYASEYLDEIAHVGDPRTVRRFALNAVAQAPLARGAGVTMLARSLYQHGLSDALDRLARRAIASADPRSDAFVGLLQMLRSQRLDTHVDALIERAVAHPELTAAVRHTELLARLRAAGEAEAAETLEAVASSVARPPDPKRPRGEPRRGTPYGLETDGSPALAWNWKDLNDLEAHMATRMSPPELCTQPCGSA
ncbi:hypothetical protein C5F59_001945 [Streptomyces sp. QL37]|uniref:hypothetical protein n=1 Tax=Streptomyces sp. QL37 TaxID=2093747 RepID=UPI000CF2BC8A|nr:hypothetical protein [Streptomyces sp. QL37]PPQ55591.1 hypothetical protein C5F59_01935 [Streptomyces sp. QL37]